MLVHWWVVSGSRRLWVCCLLTGGWSQVLGLVLDYWQAEPGPGVWLQGPGFPELVSDCWWWVSSLWHSWVWGPSCPEACVVLLVDRVKTQLVRWQGLACCGQSGSAGYGVVIFLCLMSAPWWVRLAQRLLQASWRAGLVPAHWWMELGLGLLVGRTMYRGSCGLRKSLGIILSADGWGCVPTQLVAWPEVSKHWHLQAVGWSQALELMN